MDCPKITGTFGHLILDRQGYSKYSSFQKSPVSVFFENLSPLLVAQLTTWKCFMHGKRAEWVVGSLKRGYDHQRAQVQKAFLFILFFTIGSAISVASLGNCIIASLKSRPLSKPKYAMTRALTRRSLWIWNR